MFALALGLMCIYQAKYSCLYYNYYICPSRCMWYMYKCLSFYYLHQWLLSSAFKQISLMWLHALRTILTAECYEHTFTVTMNALQLDLLAVVGAHRLVEYRTEYNNIAVNYSAVRYFVALLMIRCTCSSYSANSCWRCGCDSAWNMLQWTNNNITIMISSLSYFMNTISCYTLHTLFNLKSCPKFIISSYCMPCYN